MQSLNMLWQEEGVIIHLGGLPADGPAAGWCRLSCDAAACAASASRTTLTSEPLARGSGSSARAAAASCSCVT